VTGDFEQISRKRLHLSTRPFLWMSSTYVSIIRAKIKAARCVLIQVTATPRSDDQSPHVDVRQISSQVFTALGLTS
jgi:hypothetical protein